MISRVVVDVYGSMHGLKVDGHERRSSPLHGLVIVFSGIAQREVLTCLLLAIVP